MGDVLTPTPIVPGELPWEALWVEKEEGALEASVHVTCPMAEPAPSPHSVAHMVPVPEPDKACVGEGAELQTRVRRSQGWRGGALPPVARHWLQQCRF